ncbi:MULTISPECIES: DUF3558 family protein [Mycobacteroides]|uniref:DUF3558 family protein n=1 Tax=Mycobacteroides TaxID=670516 RepID=UPI000515EC71|nr:MULTISPECIES: DUF3558 family protein [Mycobacteroides]SKU75811.1 Protein of uncharacterised function (DUF3558) [Mycobacteroides abscessus subsp. massiliense]SKV07109.1 Protein of uncharacterised function (DUF3558) [Mycobacteroides abscessus subsp. massiliense]SLH88576.1 Protein of uncharacterised function (DUF3558) [Mycobacteroides abscessus subsp. massiliense]SLI25790.1 Protein of uncharacterised function (DUF3558) [Mycobacteroides abscessus subsp. massiliense]
MRWSMSLPIAACIVALTAAGCTDTTGGIAKTDSSASKQSASASTSTPVTNTLPSPHPGPTDNNNGTSFDPCLAYSADELRAWGVKPGSVEDLANTPSLQRGCAWSGDGWDVQQTVLNRPISDYLNQDLFPGSEQVTVEGLAAVRWRDEVDPQRVCYVELPAQKASVGTIVGVRNPQAQKVIPDACTKAMSIATDTAKKLPK